MTKHTYNENLFQSRQSVYFPGTAYLKLHREKYFSLSVLNFNVGYAQDLLVVDQTHEATSLVHFKLHITCPGHFIKYLARAQNTLCQ